VRRRRLLLGTALAAFGGCSSARTGGDRPTETGSTPVRTSTPEASPDTPRVTPAETEQPAIESAREHLAAAFDELRTMRPVGPDAIHVSEERFGAVDRELVVERVSAAAAALEPATGAGDASGEVAALRAALDLARSGRALYAAVRRGIRAEWAFEGHCFDAEWSDAREEAERARRAVAAWERHGRAVVDAVESLEATGPAPIPRLSLRAWYRDGAVLGGVSGPWTDVLAGFVGYAEAVRLDEAGLAAMEDAEYRTARDRFGSAVEAIREAHRRLARAKDDGAQGFQSYAFPIRQRCDPFRRAYETQVEAAAAAVSGDLGRAETLDSRAMDRIVTAELEHPLPEPEGGA
jgi:hypothetical protein